MGGVGSGRWGGGPLVEHCIALDIDELVCRGAIRPGHTHFRSWRLTEPNGELSRDTVGLSTRSGEPGSITLDHTAAALAGYLEGYPVALDSLRQPLGGRRWFFLCPITGERVRKLYLPRGGPGRFASKKAWGLAYATQRQSPQNRAYTRVRRLQKRLGGHPPSLRDIPDKPHRMRWTTYDREVAQIQAAVRAVDEHFMARSAAVLRRMGRL